MKITHFKCVTQGKENYFTNSILPPAASIADFAFSLAAFTLKVSLAFSF